MIAEERHGLIVDRQPTLLMGLESFSHFFRLFCATLESMMIVPLSRSTFDQRSAQTSPRRAPVVIASQTNAPMIDP
jgi:hypothetical protein